MSQVTTRYLATIVLLAGAGGAGAQAAHAPAECTRALLPAYSHNDYANAQPLTDALSGGYGGVEVDVFLIDGQLRVGHDRRQARASGTLETIYLAPLAARVARCGRLTALHGPPFLLALEIKEPSRPSYDSAVRLLSRYGLSPGTGASTASAPIEVVMVGWHPPELPSVAAPGVEIPRQWRIGSHGDTLVDDPHGRVRLISLDYGKTIGRPWRRATGRRRWLQTLAAAKRNAGGRALRVHNVPVDSVVYSDLLSAGVDVIGTRQLQETRRVLLSCCRSPVGSVPR